MEENNININEEYKRLGISRIKKRSNLFKIFMFLSFGIIWVIFSAIIFLIYLENDDTSALIYTFLAVEILPAAIVFLVFYVKNERILKNEEKLISIGKRIYEESYRK